MWKSLQNNIAQKKVDLLFAFTSIFDLLSRFLLPNNCNFDTKIIVRDNLGMNCQALYNDNYNNLLKFELHILMLGFQVSDHLFCYRLKSTTENNVLARARANDKRKTNPCLQVCISADKCKTKEDKAEEYLKCYLTQSKWYGLPG